jgi:hypothetical protein
MTTQYSEVYNVFLSKVTDYSFLNLSQLELEDELETYLKTACTKFKVCKNDLKNRNEDTKEFNNTLSDEEINILSTLMVVSYLSPMVLDTKLLKQHMGDKDFKIYSQSSHLKQIMSLRQDILSEVNYLIKDYTFNDMSSWI